MKYYRRYFGNEETDIPSDDERLFSFHTAEEFFSYLKKECGTDREDVIIEKEVCFRGGRFLDWKQSFFVYRINNGGDCFVPRIVLGFADSNPTEK